MMLAARPSYEPVWEESLEDNFDEELGDRLYYLDAGDVSRHLVALLADGRIAEFPAVFALFERLHLEGDDYVRELATIGYLEGIQFAASHEPRVEESDFVRFLEPESRRWWNGLVAFWAGEAPAVEAMDSPE